MPPCSDALTSDVREQWHRMNQPEAARFIGNEKPFQMALFRVCLFIWWLIIVTDDQSLIFHIGRIEIRLHDCVARNTQRIVNGAVRQNPLRSLGVRGEIQKKTPFRTVSVAKMPRQFIKIKPEKRRSARVRN